MLMINLVAYKLIPDQKSQKKLEYKKHKMKIFLTIAFLTVSSIAQDYNVSFRILQVL